MVKVKERLLEKIANRRVKELTKIKGLTNLLYNYDKLSRTTDKELRWRSANERYHSNDNFHSVKLNDIICDNRISSIIDYCKDHLRTIRDPLVESLVKIDDVDYAVFTFGTTYAPDLLSRFLRRELPMDEYLNYLSGKVPVAKSKEGYEYFIERPCNYEKLVAEYKQTHPDSFKEPSFIQIIAKIFF